MAVDEHEPVSTDGWLGDPELRSQYTAQRFFDFRGFALTRRIFLSATVAISLLFLGALIMWQTQDDSIALKKENLLVQSELIAKLVSFDAAEDRASANMISRLQAASQNVPALDEIEISIYTFDGILVSQKAAQRLSNLGADGETAPVRLGFIESIVQFINRFGGRLGPRDNTDFSAIVAGAALEGETGLMSATSQDGLALMGAGYPITFENNAVGSVVLNVPPGLLELTGNSFRNGLFVFYILSLLLAVVFSYLVARTISNPLFDLARAAEIGKTAQLGDEETAQNLIPDLAGRQDAVGRLSAAMREMINALYDRIDTNERFAADVVHEIKNPLASMRSAVETLRIAKDGPKRTELLNVLEHDVQRLDRMVSDISNASRLDGELVNEETSEFDLTLMLQRITEFLGMEGQEKGVELIWSKPAKPIMFDGLEERLAQVFVNLITNAISFCGEGDAVRVWARIRQNRILVVVEDTGVGIPEESLQKIFRRFYSQRPEKSFGNHSGLGLAISQQIVEAHGGVIWAENIHDDGDEVGANPIGARFIVGLPL
ncbi:sensor histidine kinase [Amylibacter ulvae]|uniref:histidine kinase n=1 Tax=Paramylibacter ulvae TaxID=1651968 RepID=A0ABQ3D5N6_9RHOB|nr:HAMP domain-containing sensor histidine kinase [Amylibacter ulvae]GHA56805.1 sensor histidine kinase [Amylibacter ulvae]